MALQLRAATLEDAPALAEIYLSAFSSDPISLLVFPRGPATTAFWLSSITEELADPFSHFLCIIDPSIPPSASPSNLNIISYGKWNDPTAPPQDPTSLPPWVANQALGDHFFSNLLRSHNELMGARKHWYLEILATRKEHQGRGAAGMLLRWGLQKADEEGTECFIEASPEGKPIYERYGYVERGRLVLDLKGMGVVEEEYVEVFMVREVKR